MELEKKFREMLNKMQAYEYMFQLAGWDSNTEAPRDSFKRRAEVLGILSKEVFALETAPEYQEVINMLYESIDTLDDHLKREIKKAKRGLDKIVNIPENEFIEYQKLLQMSQLVWEDAKKNNDYDSFKDNLRQLIDYNRKFALYYAPDKDPYDTMLDDFEEGMTTKEYDQFFGQLKEELVPFVKEVLKSGNNKYDHLINDHYDAKKQETYCDYLIDVLKFNRNRGLMKKSVHPFTWNTSPEDVRFTTRYLKFTYSLVFLPQSMNWATQPMNNRFQPNLTVHCCMVELPWVFTSRNPDSMKTSSAEALSFGRHISINSKNCFLNKPKESHLRICIKPSIRQKHHWLE